ncbi:MAG: hypothetical protein QOD74_2171 [Variibacter sp.]|nr:hypothetical protein [Variibacter sp.]
MDQAVEKKKTRAAKPRKSRPNPGKSRACVIVAGMHRSGTSAVARTLSLLGCDLPKRLMPAQPDNVAGFWESQAVAELDEAILKSAGTHWDSWEPINPDWYLSSAKEAFAEQALATLAAEYGNSRLFVLKEPRMCRMLRFWVDVLREFGATPHVVFPLRNPLDVAASLQARGGTDPSLGQLLWLRHVLDAEADSRNLKRSFIRYDALLEDAHGMPERLREDLGIAWPRRSTEVEIEIDEFISTPLRHHAFGKDALPANVSDWVRTTFDVLDRWTKRDVREHDTAQLDRTKIAFDEAIPTFSRAILIGRAAASRAAHLDAALKAEHDRAAQVEAALAAQRADLSAAHSRIAELEQQNAGLLIYQGRAEQLEGTLAKHVGELAEQSERAAHLDASLTSVAAELAATQERLEGMQATQAAELSAAEEKLAQLRGLLTTRDAEIASLKTQLADLDREVAARNAEVASAANQISELQAAIVAMERQVSEKTEALRKQEDYTRNKEVQQLFARQRVEGALQEAGRQTRALEKLAHEKDGQIALLQQAVTQRDGHIAAVQATNEELRRSTSWQLTAPVRALGEGMKRFPFTRAGFPLIQTWKSVRTLDSMPLRHVRAVQAIAQSELFDREWYLAANPDVAAFRLDPVVHYVMFGAPEGRDPGPAFSTSRYLQLYPDVAAARVNPLFHYLRFGRREHRINTPHLPRGEAALSHSYADWFARYEALTPPDRMLIEQHIASAELPELTVIWALPDARQESVDCAASALRIQLYGRWRAVIHAPTALAERERLTLPNDLASKITWSTATVGGLDDAEALVGRPILLVRGQVSLREHALYLFATAAHAGACLAYADEHDLVDGAKVNPLFKPSLSPQLARHLDYIGSCALVRLKRISDAEELRQALSTDATMADWYARFAARIPDHRAARIPFVLSENSGFRQRLTVNADRQQSTLAATLPSVSIIILTRDKLELLEQCVSSILHRTDYSARYEIIIVDNGSREQRTLNYLQRMRDHEQVRVIREDCPFNFSLLNNKAAQVAVGDVLVFLNNDTVILEPRWLQRLTEQATKPDVAHVGAKLLYPDGKVQHAGVVLGIQGVAGHAFVNAEADDGGYHHLANLDHEISSLTGACLAVRKPVFDELGGFDERLAVAFSDTLLCMDAVEKGYRNIYVGDALLVHHESKSRGLDDTEEKLAVFRWEARYARSKHSALFRDDPYYSPNLSLNRPYDLAFPPRRAKPWQLHRRRQTRRYRILILSCTHEIGYGVPVVVQLQADYFTRGGHSVFVAGPLGANDFPQDGWERIYLNDPVAAAEAAITHDIDCVIAHTPPFFSTVRWLGPETKSIIYDHGEPDPNFFDDAVARRGILAEKAFCMSMADRLIGISDAVRDQSGEPAMQVIRNGNSHLAAWDDSLGARRNSVRERLGWTDKFVVLNVCRFHAAERRYKGLDVYLELLARVRRTNPSWAADIVFVQCGKGSEDDVAELQRGGVTAFANVSDGELVDLYCAADLYANFSRWEGYNLGIGQALAMGLDVIASDIPAHRAFGIPTSNKLEHLADLFAKAYREHKSGSRHRSPRVWHWDDSLAALSDAVEELMRPEPRH